MDPETTSEYRCHHCVALGALWHTFVGHDDAWALIEANNLVDVSHAALPALRDSGYLLRWVCNVDIAALDDNAWTDPGDLENRLSTCHPG